MNNLAVAFANTLVATRGRLRDEVGTPAQLASWLAVHSAALETGALETGALETGALETGALETGALETGARDLVAGLGAGQVARFRGLRDAIRSLIGAAVAGAAPSGADLDCLNEAAAAAPRWPELTSALTIRERAEGDAVTAARAALARDAIAILGGPARSSLRACRAPGCVQFFVKDHPRREWCGPACGYRARSARHYYRRRSQW